MARKASSASKAMEVLAKLAAAQGGILDTSSIDNFKSQIEHTREAETVMRSLHKPHAYMIKKCKRTQCQQPFSTNYCSMSYCSDACLAADMRLLGINWDPYRMKRWESSMYASNSGIIYRYEDPETISTQTLLELKSWAEMFLKEFARLEETAQTSTALQNEKSHPNHFQDWDSPFDLEVSETEYLEDTPLIPESPEVPDPLVRYDFLTSLSALPQEPEENLDFF